jgi:membrane complex biogenesis BtpA family protein
MVHLGPLPGAPRFDGDLAAVIDAAVADARVLADAGFDAVGVENFGDAPFYRDHVPKVTVAAMTRAIGAVTDAVDIPVGVNVLRNDGSAALAVAAATEAAFIRVNVLSGSMWTDQGLVVGDAAEVVRLRTSIAPSTAILADVFVKHAVPPPGTTLSETAEELAGRALADGVIVSGTATGRPPDVSTLREVRVVLPTTPLFIGSGASLDNVAGFLEVADGVIVGTAIKVDGVTTNPVDPTVATAFVTAAG